ENKPTPAEIETCRPFLKATIVEMRNLRAVVTLGRISHESTVSALDHRRSAAPFGHGTSHDIGGLRIFVRYHSSRYNTRTGLLCLVCSATCFTPPAPRWRSNLIPPPPPGGTQMHAPGWLVPPPRGGADAG